LRRLGSPIRRHRVARRVAVLALCGGLSATPVFAQSAQQQSDNPLARPQDSQPKKKPPAYQTFTPGPAAQRASDAPTTFKPVPPASGAGVTGFDSTNARKSASPKRNGKPGEGDAAQAGSPWQATREIAPGTAAPPPASPYQRAVKTKPATASAPGAPSSTSAMASQSYAQGQPGAPPVSLGSPPPIQKRKKKQQVDPYDPIGFRSGGMLYYPAIELIGGYDSNPARTNNGAGARLFTVAPELRAQSDWSRHEFKAELRGSYSVYSPDPTPSLDRPYLSGKADGRIDITHDTRIDLNGHVLVSTDNPNSPNLQAGLATLPIYTTVGGTAGLGQKFNRLDVSVKGTFDRTVYQQSELTDGTTASNDDRNYNQYGAIAHVGYELRPGVEPFVEAGVDQRVHDLPVDFSGFRRDSKGWTVLGGTTFELTRLLTGEIAAGYVHREYDDPRLSPLDGVVGRGSLLWNATALTSVKFTATSTIGESTVPGVSGVLSRDAGLEVDHSFRRWLIGTLKGGIGQDNYVGSNRVDNRYYYGVGAIYKLNRFVQLKGEARREWLVSTQPVNNYSANVLLMGMRLQY
jgi:hypothetical protein